MSAAIACIVVGSVLAVAGTTCFVCLRSRTSIRLRIPRLSLLSALGALLLLLATMTGDLTAVGCSATMTLGYLFYILMTWPVFVRVALAAIIHNESDRLHSKFSSLFSEKATSDEYLSEAREYVEDARPIRVLTRRSVVISSFFFVLALGGLLCALLAFFATPYTIPTPPSQCSVLQEYPVVFTFAAVNCAAFIASAILLRRLGSGQHLRTELLAQLVLFAVCGFVYGVLQLPAIITLAASWPISIARLRSFFIAAECLAVLVITLVLPSMMEIFVWQSIPLKVVFPLLAVKPAGENDGPTTPPLQPVTSTPFVTTLSIDPPAPEVPSILVTPSSPKEKPLTSTDVLVPSTSQSSIESESTEALKVQSQHQRRESLVSVLDDDSRASEFQIFLVREFSAENLYFYRMANKFARSTKKLSDEMRLTWAQRIYDDFFNNEGVRTLNVSASVREDISRNLTLDRVRPDMFAEAQAEVLSMMERDSYPRYLSHKQNLKGSTLDPIERERAIKRHQLELRLAVDKDEPWVAHSGTTSPISRRSSIDSPRSETSLARSPESPVPKRKSSD